MVHLRHGVLDHDGDTAVAVAAAEGADLALVEGQVRGQIAGEDLGRGDLGGPLDLDLHLEATGAQDGRVDQVHPVRRADHDRCSPGFRHRRSRPAAGGTMVDSMSDEIPVPRVRNNESISSKKMMTGTHSSAFSRAAGRPGESAARPHRRTC